MYVIVKGCPRIDPQIIMDLLSDRSIFVIDNDREGELREDGSYEGYRVAVISDEVGESDKDEGGSIDYKSMRVGVCGNFDLKGFPDDPVIKRRTVQEAANNLREYLTKNNYTGWEISEVFE